MVTTSIEILEKESLLPSFKKHSSAEWSSRHVLPVQLVLRCVVMTMLVLSLTANLWYIMYDFSTSRGNVEISSYAGLSRNLTVKLGNNNDSLEDEAWTDEYHNIFRGMVALDDEFVQQHRLIEAQRWPWDSSKSVYMLNGFHSMHCVLVMRDLIMEVRDERPLTWSIGHLTHCLNALRREVECNADDFPMYTGRFHAEENHTTTTPGNGQDRTCRSWRQLNQFALDHSACWDQRLLGPGVPVTESYKACPDNSRPWENIRA